MPEEISDEVVSTKACPDHVNGRIWITVSDDLEGDVEIIMSHPSERHGASHLVVDASAVEADTAVSFFSCWCHELFDVVHVTSTSQPVHDEEDRRSCCLFP